jgi:hypothetical protein
MSPTTTESSHGQSRGLDVGSTLNGSGQASASRQQPTPSSSPSTASTASTEQPESRGLDASAGLNGDANANAHRDSTQPAGRKVEASTSADANASASRR